MALVSHIIGDCPGCGRKDSYGNVNVSGNTLARGCLSCRHWDRIPLPPLNKQILYLDQFFYSHAFRGGNKHFVEAKQKIQKLVYDQLLVAPYSNVHEDETHLWTPEQREPLWKFIKQTSVGHDFWPEYHVKEAQIHRAFEAFLGNGPAVHQVERRDAVPKDVNGWDGYVWIDVGSFRPDPATIRSGKQESVNSLLDLFPVWAAKESTFEKDVREELKGGSDSYVKLYVEYVQRMAGGDFKALMDSTVNSQIVERLMHYGAKHLPGPLRMQRIVAFFESEHFANVPVERISAEFFALLRGMVRRGAFVSREKALKRFKGFFFDVRFISTYAPYCDAMVVDTVMHRWATDPLIDLPGRFGTKLFSRANWQEFDRYLDDLARGRTPELTAALKWVHPPNAKIPDWSGMLKKMR